MDRRPFAVGTTAVIGTLGGILAPWGSRVRTLAARAAPEVHPVDAAGAELLPGDEVDLADGVSIGFVRVTRDDHCPEDLDCDAPGSADVSLRVGLEDATQNQRSFDLDLEIPLSRRVIAYDDGEIVIIAGLSGDSDVERDDLELSLVLIGTRSVDVDD